MDEAVLVALIAATPSTIAALGALISNLRTKHAVEEHGKTVNAEIRQVQAVAMAHSQEVAAKLNAVQDRAGEAATYSAHIAETLDAHIADEQPMIDHAKRALEQSHD